MTNNVVDRLIRNICFISIIVFCCVNFASLQRGAVNLKRDLFKSYDSQSRPVENSTTITTICAGLFVLQVVGLSERSQVNKKKPF